MTDQKPEPSWYLPPLPWWYSGMKVAALIFLLNALALEWAVLYHPEPGWLPHVLAGLSLFGAMLLGAWSTARPNAK